MLRKSNDRKACHGSGKGNEIRNCRSRRNDHSIVLSGWNAWTPLMETELRRLMTVASEDNEIRAIVITGAGRDFCAGADMGCLSSAASRTSGGSAPVVVDESEGDFEQRYSYLLAVPKPLIAAINGAVAGVGLCLTLFCDLRFMAAGAKLTTAFARPPRRSVLFPFPSRPARSASPETSSTGLISPIRCLSSLRLV
jgi:hypothetical protein